MSEIDNAPIGDSADVSVENDAGEAVETNTLTTSAGGSEGLDIEAAVHEALGGDPDESEVDSDDNADSAQENLEEEIKELKKKLKLKIDGEEIEEEIDWNDDDRLKRALQKEKAFDKRAQEFSRLQKQVGQFVGDLKSNPFAVLEQMGINVEEIVTEYAENAVAQSQKSPEEIAREQMEKELQDLREEKERMAKEKEEAELERMRNQHAVQIESEIKTALDATTSILPKDNPDVVAEIAKTMYFAMNNGYPNVTAKDVIPLVEARFEKTFKKMFDVFPEDIIERVVGKHNLDRVRKKRVKKRKVNTETARQAVKTTNNNTVEAEPKDSVPKTYKSMFDPRF